MTPTSSYQVPGEQAWPSKHVGFDEEADDFAYGNSVSQCDGRVQRGFLRKVFGLVATQLTITAIMSGIAMFVPAVRLFVLSSPSMLFITFIGALVTLFACAAYKDNHPTNLYWLLAFTLCMSWSIATVCAQYYERGLGIIVLEAVCLTASSTIALTVYTLTSKTDFSYLGAGLGAGLWVLILGGLMASFVAAPALHLGLAVGGAALFSLYIVYDVHMIARKLSPDEYIPASISLYLDILNLFLHILRILSSLQRD